MTGQADAADESARRSATIRTRLDDAGIVAASLRPDNTPEIETRVEDADTETDGTEARDDADVGTSEIVTVIERETTGGLRTTVNDYVVNLAVAQEVVQAAKRHADTQSHTTHDQ